MKQKAEKRRKIVGETHEFRCDSPDVQRYSAGEFFQIFERNEIISLAFFLLTLMITLYKYVASQYRDILAQLKFVFIEIISTRKNNIDFFGFDAANFFM